MALTLTTPNTILGVLEPKAGTSKMVATAFTVLAGTILMAVSARINIPLIPVPVTFQTLVVAALSAAFGWRVGVATVVAYIAEGLLGLPVFSRGGGIGYLFSPTFGFIVGMIPMAYVIGRAADAGLSRKPIALFGTMVAADALCFAFGFVWLLALAAGTTWIDQTNILGSAFAVAVQPFIVWDIIKMAFAAMTVTGAWALLSSRKA
ncbi:biotin transporter BioY [Paradevosia shaoguanensis]|uniref:Biotin transporter n=1 Tax=Paradevosia shaoguanensis TaxID=1335043 RepID=A0AA41U9Y4_9HYPH|nr:biotin transporter BioY [Paradevosia shaoguanensis]MBI4045470.1 biotin transporter BioY [Devosia nanyangense]QMV03301.1 biotin transporter BioY [Devosia sp. D6-9]CDP51019.1 Substrate-specific component BioY of biotin ECF tr ansporter [Devosia sp. DBB001]MCF1741305.1 biotin transporter BioY [Paradevosia shaoguanensis]MCI0125788.1 biotin transporter BioY [Paradevosia shaoguanensis]